MRTARELYGARRKLATAGVALLAVMVAYHVLFGADGTAAYHKKRAEYGNLQREIEELQRENERLAQQIKALKTDPRTIEKEAREQLRYARPGEVIYALPEPKPAASPATAQKR